MLALHPAVQDKVREEIHHVYGGKSSIMNNPSGWLLQTRDTHTEVDTHKDANTNDVIDQLFQLTYLQKVMMETLRLYAIIPIISKTCNENITLSSSSNSTSTSTGSSSSSDEDEEDDIEMIHIDRNTEILIPLYLMNRDTDTWGSDADSFNPDRFHSSDTHHADTHTHAADNTFCLPKLGFFPFGYGTRSCLGTVLARVECSVILCHLLVRYQLLPEKGYKPNIQAGISLTTTNGIRVVLKPLCQSVSRE